MVSVSEEKLQATVNQSDVARLIGCSRQNIHELVERYVREPMVRAGLDPPKVVTVQQVWAILVGRAARQRGESVQTAMDVVDLLLAFRPCDVLHYFERSATCVYVVNGGVLPQLVSREASDNPEMQQLRKDARAEGIDARETILETKPLLDQLIAAAEAEQEQLDPFDF